jgi:uncharacterized protein YndB with AHSA1/START domain
MMRNQASIATFAVIGVVTASVAISQTASTTQRSAGVIDNQREVPASVERVWQAWTTRDGLSEFFGEDSRVELRLGGPFEIYMSKTAPEGERGSEGCTILSYLPGEMLSFTWNAPPKFAHARGKHTWVVVQLTPLDANRTRVRVVHQGLDEMRAAYPDHVAEWNEVETYFRNAWPRVLDNLRAKLTPKGG